METILPSELLNHKSGSNYKKFIENYTGSMKPVDFATYVCKQMEKTANYSLNTTNIDAEQTKKSISGKIFELVIAEILKYHGIIPFYMQASMWNIPNSKFDFLCFDEQFPVIISVKISLAERWRQSAFEGYFFKQVYRQAKSYVITNNESQASLRNEDIKNNKISGIDHFYYVQSSEMNDLIDELKKLKFKKAELVNPISHSLKVIE